MRPRAELIDEILELTRQVRAKNVEISHLKRKLGVYKSLQVS
ncbi:MAG TPA: hypothetical protein VFZ05_02630 [Nitrososphaera sp.]